MMGKVAISLLLICGIFVCCQAASRLTKEQMFEKWVEKVRPVMMPRLQREDKRHKNKPDPTKYFDRELSVVDVVRMFVNDHGPAIQQTMEKLLAKTRDNPQKPSGTKAVTCTPLQCPPAERRGDPVKKYHKLVESLRLNPDSCAPCEFLFATLQEEACAGPWPEMRDDIIDVCENLIFPLIGMDPVMCNGTVTLQGEHIYCVLLEATTFDICESLNMCYPVDPPKTRFSLARMLNMLNARANTDKHKRLKIKQWKQRRHRRQEGVITIAQLTDIHTDPKYAVGAPADCKANVCCLETSLASDGATLARKWGEYQCNLPERTMQKFLEKINEFSPDFVLYAGDNPPHTIWEETVESQLDCSRIAAAAMKNTFPANTRVYPAIGNHEMFPTNLYSKRLPETNQMNIQFAAMWSELAGLDATANATFADMSYFTVLHQPGLRILVINSNYDWYSMNFYNTLNKDQPENADHKTFVENVLSNAASSGEKVIIVSHHPIGSSVIRNTRWWEQMMIQYGSSVVLHISGHTHKDHFHVVLDPDTDEAKSVNLVSPVVTTNTNVNPSMRIIELDSTTFELLDVRSYHFDVTLQLQDEDPEIVLNYDSRIEYNMPDLSPASWHDLALRFVDDDELLQTYHAHRNGDVDGGPCFLDDYCSESCKKSTICGILYPAADQKANCEDTFDQLFPTDAPPAAFVMNGAESNVVPAAITAVLAVASALVLNGRF